MDEVSRQIVKQAIGITDQDLARLSPGMNKLLTDLPEKMKWKIIAEVTESKYCFAGLKPGDKFVINFPVLNVSESSAAPCIEAIAPLTNHIRAMVDRVAAAPSSVLITVPWTRSVSGSNSMAPT